MAATLSMSASPDDADDPSSSRAHPPSAPVATASSILQPAATHAAAADPTPTANVPTNAEDTIANATSGNITSINSIIAATTPAGETNTTTPRPTPMLPLPPPTPMSLKLSI